MMFLNKHDIYFPNFDIHKHDANMLDVLSVTEICLGTRLEVF